MKRRLVPTALLALVTLVGAASAQTAPAPLPAPAPEEPRAPVVPTVSDPMLAPAPAAQNEVHSFGDAIALVREHSPDYVSNLETIKRAEAQSRIALSQLLPVVNGTASYTHNFSQTDIPFGGAVLVSPAPNLWLAGASATWTPLNPHASHALGTARAGVDVAKRSFGDRRRQIASSVVASMLATLSTSRVAELNRTGLRTSLERLSLTQARLQYGQGTPLDVDRAEQDVAIARRLIIDGDESLKQAREALGVALGSQAPLAVSSDFDVESFEREVARTCRLNDALESRPDVAAARGRLEIAKRSETDAKLLASPTLGLASQGGYSSAPILAPAWTFAIQAVLTVPLYDGGYRYGVLHDAEAMTEQARAALASTRLLAVVTSARAARQVEVALADRDVTKTQRDLAARIDLRTRDAYARGRGTSLDLVTSAQALRQAEITLALLEFQFAQARADAVLENAECVY